MTLPSFIEYLKYRRKAKTRHGVHSPFVFDFIEKMLRKRVHVSPLAVDKYLPVNELHLPENQRQLLFCVIRYFHSEHMINFIENEKGHVEKYIGTDGRGRELQPVSYDADCMLLCVKDPHAWSSLFRMYQNTLSANSMVVVMNIHQTKLHTELWEQLYNKTDVRLSIDIFDMGLLFFKEEFKEKQHFILKR